MENLVSQLNDVKKYFHSGTTLSYQFRKQQLLNLKKALYKYESEIYDALYKDLKKNKEEVWITEIGFIIKEINFALKHLKSWMLPKKVGTNLLNFPGKSYIMCEPLGVVLIISPWNYPLQLLLAPLVGAIAAGNCAVIKPSEFAHATAVIIEKIMEEVYDKNYIKVIQGHGAVVIPEIMNNFRFDHIFYTGSTHVGQLIYEMAAKKLVPVTLELGGKSPCIIESDANLKVAAKRIALTKFSNAGQMCVAPDYILVHESIKEKFVEELKNRIDDFYNKEHVKDYHFGKVINENHFERLLQYINEGHVIYGGNYNKDKLFIEPTLLDNVDLQSQVMKDEIFGPVLPIISWKTEDDIFNIIALNKDPLAFYVFTEDDNKAKKWIQKISFGGGCINNASWHLTNINLPFGGRGNSGIGAYHGKFSFQTFSHKKGIMKTPTWFDPSFKYPPFNGKLNLFKRFIK